MTFFFFFNLTAYWQADRKSISVSKSSKSYFRIVTIMGFFLAYVAQIMVFSVMLLFLKDPKVYEG